jgi:glutathione-regulated potassium-efflux system ancillary protein KefG
VDAQGVADLLGLAQRTAVSVYQGRYPDMPRPIVVLSGGRTRLWLRTEIVAWAKERESATGRNRGPSASE